MRILLLNKDYIYRKKPSDYAFMEESEAVLKHHPDTWKVYPKTLEGAMAIVKMEYKELENSKDKEHELVHLASACLYAWRMMHDNKSNTESDK